MQIKILNKNGITLCTAKKYCEEDIIIKLDNSLIPVGSIDITNTEEVDVTRYARAKIKDENLKAENIAENVEVLGITGTFRGGIDTSDATVEFDLFLQGETTSISNNRVTKLKNCFSNNYIITSVSFPNVTLVDERTFSGCTYLKDINLPKVEMLGSFAFHSTKIEDTNSVFKTVNQFKSNSTNHFYSCTNLYNLHIPNFPYIPNACFASCSNLKTIKCDVITSIGNHAFNVCRSLIAIILPMDYVVKLENVNFISDAYRMIGKVNNNYNPNGLKDGRIYVHPNRVEEYKAASNWSEYADIICSIEEYEEVI